MTPAAFPESNRIFGPPPDLAESQCRTIPAYLGEIKRGSLEGASVVVVAWQPTTQDLENLLRGCPIYLACVGGLPPHLLGTTFEEVTNPA